MEVWFNSLDTPPAYVEVSCFPLPLSLSCATRRSIRFWFAAKKTVSSRCFFGFILFSEVLDLWPGLACRPPRHCWRAFIGSRAVCLFSLLLLGMKDGGYLGLPSSGAFRVRAEDKLPSTHNVPASIPVSQDIPSRWPWNSATAFQNTTFKPVSCHVRLRIKVAKEGSPRSNRRLRHQSSINNRQTVLTSEWTEGNGKH